MADKPVVVFGDVVLRTKNLGQEDVYTVDEDIVLIYDGWRITVKKGYKTDGASIPRLVWDNIGHPFYTKFITAAIFHDILYETEVMPIQWTDDMFGDILEASGVPEWKEWIMEHAVEWFGDSTWEKHTEAQITQAKQYLVIERL